MTSLFDKLPTILVLAVLVGIFVALRRHVKSPRLGLWIAAWILVYLRFFAGLFEPADGNLSPGLFILEEGSLALAALFFVASLTSFFENRKQTITLLLLGGVPSLAYIAGMGYEKKWPALYIICLSVIFFGIPVFVALF